MFCGCHPTTRPSSLFRAKTEYLSRSAIMESLKRTEYYYGKDNVLQNVIVWEFPKDRATQPAPGTTMYWLM